MSRKGKTKTPKPEVSKPKPESPKTKVLRLTDKHFNIMMQATTHLQEAQALLQNVMVGVFAAHDMAPTKIMKTDKDDKGHFLVVQVPE